MRSTYLLCLTNLRLVKIFVYKKLNLTIAQLNDPKLNVLESLGFTQDQIKDANDFVCGTMTIENAPHLKRRELCNFRLRK